MKVWLIRSRRSRTMIFAAVLAVLGVLQTSMDAFTPYMTPQAVGIFTMFVSVIIAVLRVVTTQPLTDK